MKAEVQFHHHKNTHEIFALIVPMIEIELGASDVNQVNTVLDKDKGNNFTLYTSDVPTSLQCAKNCPMCSKVVLPSSPINLTKSRILNHEDTVSSRNN